MVITEEQIVRALAILESTDISTLEEIRDSAITLINAKEKLTGNKEEKGK